MWAYKSPAIKIQTAVMQLFFHIIHIAGSISITEMKYFPASSALLKMQRFRFKNEKRFWMNDSISQASLGHNDARRGPTMRVDDQLAASLEEKKNSKMVLQQRTI
jgi:hypothetical protein